MTQEDEISVRPLLPFWKKFSEIGKQTKRNMHNEKTEFAKRC